MTRLASKGPAKCRGGRFGHGVVVGDAPPLRDTLGFGVLLDGRVVACGHATPGMPQVSVPWTVEDGVGRTTGGIMRFVVPSAGDVMVTEGTGGVVVMVTDVSPSGFVGCGGGTTRLHAVTATAHA